MEFVFDEMSVDTTLAKDFLKSIVHDSHDNDMGSSLFYNGKNYHSDFFESLCKDALKIYNCQQLKTLSEKIKENIDLLAQLEYVKREIPIEDSRKQVNLIIQQLNYVFAMHFNEEKDNSDVLTITDIYMSHDSPLLMLGFIGKGLMEFGNCFKIHTEEATKAVCVLFTKLCYEVGLPVVTSFEKNLSNPSIKGMPSFMGAVGVICEHSDVDSAVDMFLNSSAKAPWRLQRILVQESLSQQFKNALTWKCNLNQSPSFTSFIYLGREFLLDQLGSTEPNSDVIYVDTYRTTKELLSLLKQYQTYYLSLWANNIAEINEIAYSVRTPIVWVNNFADFRGPAKITEAIYPPIFISHKRTYAKCQTLTTLSKLCSSWSKLSYESRRDIICNILTACDTNDSHRIANSIISGSNNSLVYINKDFVCSVVSEVFDNVLYLIDDKVEATLRSVDFFESVIMGAAYAIDVKIANHEVKKMFSEFTESNVPIVYFDQFDQKFCNDGLTLYWNRPHFNVSRSSRLISTNSGTTFAN